MVSAMNCWNFAGRAARLVSITIAVCLTMTTGCVDVFCSIVGCPGYVPDDSEYEAYEAAVAEFDQSVADAPDVPVRVVNETGVIVAINVHSTFVEPPCLYCDVPTDLYRRVDEIAALVEAGGTVMGTIKCGELLVVYSVAPYDTSIPLSYGQQCGFSTLQGNVNFSGIGSSGETDVSGDVVASTRCIRPADDGLDCENGTIVITIRELAREAEFDEETGELISPQVAAMGTIEVE